MPSYHVVVGVIPKPIFVTVHLTENLSPKLSNKRTINSRKRLSMLLDLPEKVEAGTLPSLTTKLGGGVSFTSRTLEATLTLLLRSISDNYIHI